MPMLYTIDDIYNLPEGQRAERMVFFMTWHCPISNINYTGKRKDLPLVERYAVR